MYLLSSSATWEFRIFQFSRQIRIARKSIKCHENVVKWEKIKRFAHH